MSCAVFEVNVTVALTQRPTARPSAVSTADAPPPESLSRLPSLTQARARAVIPCLSASSGLAPAASSSLTMPTKSFSIATTRLDMPSLPTASRAPAALVAATSRAAAASCALAHASRRAVIPRLLVISGLAPAATSSSTTPHNPCILACINAVAPSSFCTSRAPAACVGAMSIATSSSRCARSLSTSSCESTEMFPKLLFKTHCFASSAWL